ncbi:MAG: VWA domain-containing protein [Spirochaetales bacterium]|nr:VWA domain-containing protein [Spirochaetales bacterium]
MNIDEILKELYLFDPALRSEEAVLKKMIEKLIKTRPESEPDKVFKERLKAELLEKMEKKKVRPGFFVTHRKAIVGAAGIAAVLIVVLSFAINPSTRNSFSKMESNESADLALLDEAVVEQDIMEKEIMPLVTTEEATASAPEPRARVMKKLSVNNLIVPDADDPVGYIIPPSEDFNTEEYSRIYENDFFKASAKPLSTLSIDVDTASYSNVRRFITGGSLPNPDAVRIEELINYFDYDYPQPKKGQPFSFNTELAHCPWNNEHLLLQVGLKGYEVQAKEIPQTNLVFLIDSSGSMMDESKLPLLKKSMALLVKNLRKKDRVSIVAYAGSAGLVLPPTAGNKTEEILGAIDSLDAGGSTAGGEGIDLAYKTAAENLFERGNNRVILATDGDFNVGQSSEAELTRMIEERRNQGIFLTVLGFGMGNYKDSRMESLADKGNGTYAYIDNLNEARKVFVEGLGSTLLTIAKDVKIQIEFNPAEVDSYRLIGYENRVMEAQDFDNDKKDAGEIGAGHTVTALYEIIPAASGAASDEQDSLRYQDVSQNSKAASSGELGYIKFRYKEPDEDESKLIESPIGSKVTAAGSESENFRFASAVTEWGMLLRQSKYSGDAEIGNAISLAKGALGEDKYGYRAEFLSLLYKTKNLLGE